MVCENKSTKNGAFPSNNDFMDVKSRYDYAIQEFGTEFKHHKSVIVEEIIKVAPSASIYLTGSFGRNEGSLKFEKGKSTPLRDYDIIVVSNEIISQETIDSIRVQIHSRLGLSHPFSRDFKFGGFTVWITQTSLKSINAFPLLKYYELKHSSKLLRGEDVREDIKIDFEDVAFYNGVLILFSKIEGLVGLIKIDNLRNKNERENLDDVVYECLKSYTEIGTCLSLLVHDYGPSFLSRNLKVQKSFDSLHSELNSLSPNLPSRIIASSYQRLLIEDNFIDRISLGDFVNDTLTDLKAAIWYYLRNAYQIDITYSFNYNSIFEEYLDKLNSKPLEELFSYYLKRKLGFCPKKLERLVASSYLRYCSLKFFIICHKNGYRAKTSILLMRNSNLMLRLWLIGFLVLGSIQNDLEINEKILNDAEEKLSEIINLNYNKRDVHEDKDSRFESLRKTESRMLDLADKVFHRKN